MEYGIFVIIDTIKYVALIIFLIFMYGILKKMGLMLLAKISLVALVVIIALPLVQYSRKHIERQSDRSNLKSDFVKFYNICNATKDNIQINKRVKDHNPVTVFIKEPVHIHMLQILDKENNRDEVCWLKTGNLTCNKSNVGIVLSNVRGHKQGQDECTQLREIDLNNNTDRTVKCRYYDYILDISENKVYSYWIDKYEIKVIDNSNGRILGKSIIYRRKGFTQYIPDNDPFYENLLAWDSAPRYCPNRDLLIAELLAEVFPKPD